MAGLFGLFKKDEDKKSGLTFAKPSNEDGAIDIEVQDYPSFAGATSQIFDIDRIPTDEYDLISVYRTMSLNQEIDEAVQEIINEAIVSDEDRETVSINLDKVEGISNAVKDKISDEFSNVLKMLNFANRGYNYFNRWYVDGKLIFHKVVGKNTSTEGILDIIPIDPVNIKLVREIPVKRIPETGDLDIYDLSKTKEYYIYSKTPINAKTSLNTPMLEKNGVKIPKEAITYVTSGVTDESTRTVLSYLYKAIKPWNNLKLMEDSVVVYRVTRAPDRRVFYVDVGTLPTGKANQYLKDVMARFKNKIVYDASTGTVASRKKYHAMTEDLWLPRREGGRGTEVSSLPGGTQLGEITDVEYFKNKLLRSLNVPLSRFMQDGAAFNVGRTTEITRDEVKFSKFISRLRKRFSQIFDDILRTQLILKKVITREDWDNIKDDIAYTYLEDNMFSEFKEMELLRERVELVGTMMQNDLVGPYYTHDWVKKNVLKLTGEEIEALEKDKEEERKKLKDEDIPTPDGQEPEPEVEPEVEPEPAPVVEPDKPVDNEDDK